MSVRNTFPQQRPTLNLDFANSKTLDPRITFTRTSTATYVDEDGLIKSVDADVARFDHDPVTGECLGLLVEEQRSNLLTYSDQLDEQSNWVDSGTSWSANTIISPDGTQNADDPGFVSEKWGFYDDTNSSWISGYPQNYPFTVTSEWVRHSATITTPSGCTTLRFYPLRSGNDTSYIFQRVGVSTSTTYTASAYYKLADDGTTVIAWGAQLETGAFPTSYIPRPDTSTATRNPDSVSMTGDNFSDWYNPSEGTLLCVLNISRDLTDLNTGSWTLDNGSFARGLGMAHTINNPIRLFIRDSENQKTANVSNVTLDEVKICSQILLNTNGVNEPNLVCVDGIFTPDTPNYNISDEVSISRLVIGQNNIAGSPVDNYLNGTISKLTYYPTRLSNNQLQNLTK